MKGVAMRAPRQARLSRTVCQFCQWSTTPRARPHSVLTPSHLRIDQARRRLAVPPVSIQNVTTRFASSGQSSQLPSNPDEVLQQLTQEHQSLKDSEGAPSEEAVAQLLRKCLQVVERFESLKEQHGKDSSNATSSLLDLQEKALSAERAKKTRSVERRLADKISQIANEVLLDPNVFISPEALEYYTKIQTLLKRPDHFPKIFALYATKPIPEPNTTPVKFREQNANSVKNAVPSELANLALDVAVEQKNLPLALAIIDNTFCTPAFYRAKIFKKAALPLTGLATAPLASYVVATWSASLQNTMDPAMATGIAFTATLAYIGFTSSVGLIAITTANDQMDRVVWASGIPLRHRWLREEERAALDKVAGAWGFKDPYRRGEEEGDEWESLREFIGMRGMVLDKTELMEGMQ